jgi:hypothetical protein
MSSFCCIRRPRRSASRSRTASGPLVARDFVQIEQFGDLGQRKAEPLAAQDQLQAYALALAVDAPGPAWSARSSPSSS